MSQEISNGQSFKLPIKAGSNTPVTIEFARIEGRIRDLRQMVVANRPVAEQIGCINAVTAALREVAMLIIARGVEAKLDDLFGPNAGTEPAATLHELVRGSFRLPDGAD